MGPTLGATNTRIARTCRLGGWSLQQSVRAPESKFIVIITTATTVVFLCSPPVPNVPKMGRCHVLGMLTIIWP